MPGNKNSGRKKSISIQNISNNDVPAHEKKKPGRPKLSAVPSKPTDKKAEEGSGQEQATTVDVSPVTSPINTPASHHVNLKKRTSDISKFYDAYIGVGLECFPSSKIPQKRVVLQR